MKKTIEALKSSKTATIAYAYNEGVQQAMSFLNATRHMNCCVPYVTPPTAGTTE